jgi:hypothetical protein
MIYPVKLTEIVARRPESIQIFRRALADIGFALVQIDVQQILQGIRLGLDEAAKLDSFRFPPLNGETVYNDVRRNCFRSLFEVGVSAAQALITTEEIPTPLQMALANVNAKSLFSSHPNEPFQSKSEPFGLSFFNVFNYKEGMLNLHKDRGLLTVIASARPDPTGVSLWVRSPTGSFNSMDDSITNKSIVAILLGEDAEQLSACQGLYAAEHAVRVNPLGDFVCHSHFRADPDTPIADNPVHRTSVAMILQNKV